MLVDTARGTYTIDMVGLPDTTIAMPWSAAQLDTLRSAAVLLHVLELATPCPATQQAMPSPEGTFRSGIIPGRAFLLEVEMNGVRKRFEWSTDTLAWGREARDRREWKRLWNFAALVDNMARRHPAMRTAPRPVGGYM